MISAHTVTFTYPSGKTALHDINREVADGEYLAIVGHNGSGKSTLARILAGLEKPGSGDIVIGGINTRDKKQNIALRKEIGIVFQNPENQIVFEKVADDLRFGLANLGLPNEEIEKRVSEVTEKLGIGDFHNSFELSMGQKQRVAIASVLAMKPRAVVFDEPTAMLDPRGKKEIQKIIKELHRAGLTIIYVTNIIDEVIAADRLVVLEHGALTHEYRRNELFDNCGTLKSLGLEMPVIMELLFDLQERGINIVVKRWAVEDVVDAVTEFLSSK
jgi:energy-coupling factor transport system ATP-binding protein